MKKKAVIALALMLMVALGVWFVLGAAEAVEGLVFDLLMAIEY